MAPQPGEGSMSSAEHDLLCDDFLNTMIHLSDMGRMPLSEQARPEWTVKRNVLLRHAVQCLKRLTMPF